MSSQHWQQIERLFHAALARDASERDAFLSEVCGKDTSLRSAIESLLAHHEQANSFIESPAFSVAGVLDDEQESLAGQTIGNYRIIELLGEGGMGAVYLAEDTKLGRKVALKFLSSHFTEDKKRLHRFEQEARAASALNHPNICVIHEISEAVSGVPFISMEYIEGITLRQHIERVRMSVGDVLNMAVQIASALSAAHEAGIVHRDIKPENLMVRPDGYVKVLDFGLAKLAESASPMAIAEAPTKQVKTGSGIIMGTVGYMSPEQARGQTVDGRSDIFNFGAVLYEILAGHRPFDGETPGDILAAILKTEPPLLSHFAPEAPAELTRIVSKALRKDRELRYQTIKDLMLDLQSLKQQTEFEAKLEYSKPPELKAPVTVASEPSVAETASEPIRLSTSSFKQVTDAFKPRRRRVIAVAAAIVVVLAVVLGYAFLFRKTAATTALPEIRSLAVIPLDNLSGDPAQQYFADGMTEEVITELSKISALRVISRTSTVQYKGTRKTMPEIARELNVDGVIEGSVLRSGDRVRITVQLIHAPTDRHLWAQTYERDVRDVLGLQSDVSRAIASEIKIKLTPQEQVRSANSRAVNPQAFDAYLKGLDFFNQSRGSKNAAEVKALQKTSADYFEQAIRIQPDYAPAYAELATVRHWVGLYPQSKEAAMKALEIDETVAEAHAALGYVLLNQDWDFAGAEREVKRAIELNPNDSEAHWVYALHLMEVGRHDEAIREINLAEQLDPLSTLLKINVGTVYLYARQYDRAIEQLRGVLDKEPNALGAHIGLGWAYVYKGMYDEGIAEIRKGIEFWGNNPSRRPSLALAYAVSGNRSEAIKILNESMKALASGEQLSKVNIALTYAALGDKDQAFAWLEKAYAEHSADLLLIKSAPKSDILRSDPRFTDLLQRIGFPQ